MIVPLLGLLVIFTGYKHYHDNRDLSQLPNIQDYTKLTEGYHVKCPQNEGEIIALKVLTNKHISTFKEPVIRFLVLTRQGLLPNTIYQCDRSAHNPENLTYKKCTRGNKQEDLIFLDALSKKPTKRPDSWWGFKSNFIGFTKPVKGFSNNLKDFLGSGPIVTAIREDTCTNSAGTYTVKVEPNNSTIYVKLDPSENMLRVHKKRMNGMKEIR